MRYHPVTIQLSLGMRKGSECVAPCLRKLYPRYSYQFQVTDGEFFFGVGRVAGFDPWLVCSRTPTWSGKNSDSPTSRPQAPVEELADDSICVGNKSVSHQFHYETESEWYGHCECCGKRDPVQRGYNRDEDFDPGNTNMIRLTVKTLQGNRFKVW